MIMKEKNASRENNKKALAHLTCRRKQAHNGNNNNNKKMETWAESTAGSERNKHTEKQIINRMLKRKSTKKQSTKPKSSQEQQKQQR